MGFCSKVSKKTIESILWDFVVKLLKLKDPVIGQKYNIIFIIINKFIKWGYFVVYTEEILIKNIIQIYIKEVFIRYKVLDKIILNRNIKFIVIF